MDWEGGERDERSMRRDRPTKMQANRICENIVQHEHKTLSFPNKKECICILPLRIMEDRQAYADLPTRQKRQLSPDVIVLSEPS